MSSKIKSTAALAAIFAMLSTQCHAQITTPAGNIVQYTVPKPTADTNLWTPEDGYALPWSSISESNILWKKRVWRSILVSDAGNEAFSHGNGSLDLANLIIRDVMNDAYKAYSAADGDRFTKVLSIPDLSDLLAGDKNGASGYAPVAVTSYEIKEDWLFLEKEHKLVVRIVGIAPCRTVAGSDGVLVQQPLFWLYYPDIRKSLATQKVHPGQGGTEVTWDEYFEMRRFSSTIKKIRFGQYKGAPKPDIK